MVIIGLMVAGGCGAVLRVIVDAAVRRRQPGVFPLGTLLVNVSGALLLGVLTGLATHGTLSHTVLTVLGTGLCGGYTTFSTATFESISLADRGHAAAALVNVAASLLLTVAAAAGGLLLGERL